MPTVDEYLAMLQPDPAQLKQQKIAALLGGLGAGLLSAPGWNRGIANAGLLAAQGVSTVPYQMRQDAIDNLKMREAAQGLADKDQQRASDQAWQSQLPALFQGPKPYDRVGSGSPTVGNAAALNAMPGETAYQKYSRLADAAFAAGRPNDAKIYAEYADKNRPKVKNENTGTDAQGNRVRYVTYEDGTTQVLPVGPDKEKLNFVSTGGQVGVGLDPFTGKQMSGGLAATMDPAQIDAKNRGWAGLDLEKQKFAYQQTKDAADSVTGKKPSDQQLAARGFLTRMQNAGGIVNNLEAGGYTPGFGSAYVSGAQDIPVVGGMAAGAANAIGGFFSPEMQSYRQAQEDWVRAKLRKESGAVIGKDEMAGEIKTYFPQPGDSKEVIDQKARARAVAEQQMAIQGGLERFGQAPKQVVRTGVEKATGKRVVQYADGTTAYAE